MKPSKSSASVPILLDRKSDNYLWLYIKYRALNKPTIKNQYRVPLIGESLNRLEKAK